MSENVMSSLSKILNDNLEKMGVHELNQLQTEVIPQIIENKNLIVLAQTGSGKTLSYLTPIIQKMIGHKKGEIKALIIVPTKELALQVTETKKELSKNLNIYSYTLIGGENVAEQLRKINKGIHLLIATPGRIKDLISKRAIDLNQIEHLILDEFDMMMDMGYHPQIEMILNATKNRLSTQCLSATMSDDALDLITNFIHEPVTLNFSANSVNKNIEEFFCDVKNEHKYSFLKFLIKKEKIRSAIIFCNTKDKMEQLSSDLKKDKYKVTHISGDMSNHARQKAFKDIKEKNVQFLIATDLASRGIDIPHLTHIINYEIPLNSDSYIHRVGRTARFLKTGIALTLCNIKKDEAKILKIKDEINLKKYTDFTPLKKARPRT